MRKTHMKLGSLLPMTCLFLAAGMLILGSQGSASAQSVQASKKFHHWFATAPHISVKMLLPNAAHHSSRVVISGVGFDDCGACAPTTSNYGPCDAGCSTTNTTNTDVDTNTTTTTTTTVTKSSSQSTAPAPTAPSYSPAPSTCPSDCGNSAPAPAPSTCPSDCGNSAPAPSTCPSDCGNYSAPAPSTCPSNCGNYSAPAPTAPSYSAPAPSYNGCSCNTVNLQSSTPISAPGVNLSQIPVNPFGEFNITVNVLPMHRHHTAPNFWAVNSYNSQPSNYAPMCYCS